MEWLSRATLTVDYWCCLYSSYQLSRYLATPYQPLGAWCEFMYIKLCWVSKDSFTWFPWQLQVYKPDS